MRALMIVLPIVLFAISAMPEPAAAQACLICVQEGICHGFVQGSDTACDEDNRDENPSCRDCSEAPDGHIGCHVETCGSEWACSQHGGPSCGTLTEEEQEEQELLVAMASGKVPFDAEAAGALVAQRADLRYDRARAVIQRIGGRESGGGSVVLQVPVPSREALVVERVSNGAGRLKSVDPVDAFANLRTPTNGSGTLVHLHASR